MCVCVCVWGSGALMIGKKRRGFCLCLHLSYVNRGDWVHYQQDGWSCDMSSRKVSKIQLDHSALVVRRNGRLRMEYMLNRGFAKRMVGDVVEVAVKVGEPIGMSLGKAAWHAFSAACDFVPIPRSLGAKGITITAYVLDGALFQPVRRHCMARHALYYDDEYGVEVAGVRLELAASDWVVGMKCVLHGCGNSIKWGLLTTFPHVDRDAVHIMIKALNNCKTALYSKILTMLMQCMHFAPAPSGTIDEIKVFWSMLGVEGDMLAMLIRLDLRWRNGVLWVSSAFENDQEIFQRVADIVLYLYRFLDFSETRWGGVGRPGRFYLRARAAGITHVVRLVREDPSISDYHMHGFDDHRCAGGDQFLATAALSSCCAEAAIFLLTKDDRFLRNNGSIWAAAEEQFERLVALPLSFYKRVQQTISETQLPQDGVELQQQVLHAAVVQLGYLYRDSFLQLHQLPLSLTQNDIRANLVALDALPRGVKLDPQSENIKFLLDVGYPIERLINGLTLQREMSCSTLLVEQDHKHSRSILQFNPYIEEKSFKARCIVRQCEALTRQTTSMKGEGKFLEKIAKLDSKVPARMSPFAMFCKEVTAERGSDPAYVGLSGLAKLHRLNRLASDLWKGLPNRERLTFARQAQRHAADASADIDAKRAALYEELRLYREKLALEKAQSGVSNHMDNFRFSPADIDSVTERFRRLNDVSANVVALEGGSFSEASPSEPSLEQQAVFIGKENEQLAAATAVPLWGKYVAQNRDAFFGVALGAVAAIGDPLPNTFYLFLEGNQKTCNSTFVVLRRQPRTLPDLGVLPRGASFQLPHEERFEYLPLEMKVVREVPFKEDEHLIVLRAMRFHDRQIRTSRRPESFDEFIAPYRPSLGRDEPREAAVPPSRIGASDRERLLVEFPWLREEDFKRMRQPTLRRVGGGGEGGVEAVGDGLELDAEASGSSDAEDEELDLPSDVEEDVDAEISALREKHAIADFDEMWYYPRILCGKWTKLHCDVAANGVVGLARGLVIKEWADEFGFRKQLACYYKKFGEYNAHLLVDEFCRRGNHFASILGGG